MRERKVISVLTAIPSVNSLYRGRRFLTKEGKETKEAIGLEILSQVGSILPTEEQVSLEIKFYFGNKRKNDIDNRLKALLDCMTGYLYGDDSQIKELHVYKEYDKENPRTEIKIL
jgi:Holliday junction resolvase RusA-like endonuclease